MPGPPPKRSEQRRRRNQPEKPVTSAPGFASEALPADEGWHPAAKQWYESLARSGQSAFYQASDWAAAFVLAESMSRELSPQPIVVGKGETATVEMHNLPPKGASLSAWLKGMTALMATEGDRRRAALELQRAESSGAAQEASGVSDLAAWRARTDGAG